MSSAKNKMSDEGELKIFLFCFYPKQISKRFVVIVQNVQLNMEPAAAAAGELPGTGLVSLQNIAVACW